MKKKRLQYDKVLGTINPATLLTKYLTPDVIEGHCAMLGVQSTEGRAKLAPTLSRILEGEAEAGSFDDTVINAVAGMALGFSVEDSLPPTASQPARSCF